MSIEDFKKRLSKIETKRSLLREERKEKLKKLEYWANRHDKTLQARVFAQSVAQHIQSKIEFKINNIVSMAIEEVWPEDPYKFITRFVSRRGKSECDLLFSRKDREIHPLDSSGYGPCNVASVTGRFALWSLNKNRPTFLLDQPFSDLSLDRCDDASQMLQDLCRRLGIQIIMISHDPEIVNYADKIIRIS